jgi:hypothetical protein
MCQKYLQRNSKVCSFKSQRDTTLHMPGHKGSSEISLSIVQPKSRAIPCHGFERGHEEESFARELLNILLIFTVAKRDL